MTPLIWAMQANNKAGFVRLLARGGKVDYLVPRRESTTLPAPVSRSLIGIAAANPTDSEWLLILLKQSANPNLVYPKIGNDDVTDLGAGMTPLFNAVQSGRTENVDLLLRYGAQINHQDNGGVTPLIFAASTCLDFKMALHLLKAGADYRIRSNNGESFAYHAVCGEVLAKDVISFLEQHGVSMAEARAKLAKEKKEEKARRGIRCQEPITQSVPDTLSSPTTTAGLQGGCLLLTLHSLCGNVSVCHSRQTPRSLIRRHRCSNGRQAIGVWPIQWREWRENANV